jgi:hypothetical protein
MKKLFFALAVAFLLSIAVASAQDTGESELRKLVDAFAPYIDAVEKAIAGFVPLPVCADLDNANLLVSNLDDAVILGAVYCREIAQDGAYQLNPGVIGDQRVIERDVQQAYDVFGLTAEGDAVQRFNDAITVCLKGRGALLFLPSFASPRPVQTPQSYASGDFTCARLGSSGIVALVND